jgi:rare lipoprotein A
MAAILRAVKPSRGRHCFVLTGARWLRAGLFISRAVSLCAFLSFAGTVVPQANAGPRTGLASWYGEEHRGKLMANGKRFNPDKFTAASWFYPLGTKVWVMLDSPSGPRRTVLVTITDRGPAKELVREGRIVDLSHAPFKRLAEPALGLVAVIVEPLR